MSNAVKVIENPEVPGLECLLPPPPPPPPPPVISEAGAKASQSSQLDTKVDECAENAASKTVGSVESKISAAKLGDAANTPFGITANPAGPIQAESPGLISSAMHAPYFLQSAIPQAPGSEQPWWVPSDSDTSEVFRSFFYQRGWTLKEERAMQAGRFKNMQMDSDTLEIVSANRPWVEQTAPWSEATPKIISPGNKTNCKFLKRKSECIDPAQDAERVASAQKELSALMKPLKCDLCNAITNSTLQAKLHYEGKPHQKKVSMFLNQSVKKIKPDDGQVTSTTSNNDWNTYCDLCKTWFTSQIDANKHYAGKKHIRATMGVAKHKTKKLHNQVPVDPTGRFGIGMPFAAEPQVTILSGPKLALPPPVAPPVALPATTYPPPAWPLPTFRCDLCGVTTNRLEQLEDHKRGAKHMKMLKMSGLASTEPDVINATTTQTAPTIDYSIYRTPSGQYYCAPCNSSFHSKKLFAQHVESNKHKMQVNPKQAVPAPAAAKKTNKLSK